MEPYAVLKIGNHEFKTAVAHEGGHLPKWGNEEWEIKVEDLNHEVHYQILDAKLLHSDNLGTGVIHLRELTHGHGVHEWFDIHHDGKLVGQILIKTEYHVEVDVTKQTVVHGAHGTVVVEQHKQL